MRTGHRREIVDDMGHSAPRPTLIRIYLRRDMDPISGTVHTAEGDREFVGWLELINAIEDGRSSSGGKVDSVADV